MERQKRQEGPYEIGDITVDELLRTGTHDVYEGLLHEHRMYEDLEYKRRLKNLRDKGTDPFEDGYQTLDRILNDPEPKEPDF